MEAKDLLDFLGLDPEQVKDIDTFKGEFGKKYFTEKQIHSDKELLGRFTGKTMQKVTKAMLDHARELELDVEDLKADTPEDTIKAITGKLSAHYGKQIEDVKSQVGKSGEEAIKPWQEKVSKFEQALNDEKKAKKEIAEQFEGYKKTAADQIKATRIDYFKKDLMTSIGYDPTVMKDDLKRKGWESHVAENFRFDFDEHDQPIITDKTGAKIKNPKKADEWLAPKDVLAAEAEKLGLLPKNPQGGKPAAWTPPATTPAPATVRGAFTPGTAPAAPTQRRVMPGMEQYVGK